MNNLIYVLGGIPAAAVGNPAVKTVEVYNPRTDTWSDQVEMPTGRSHFGASIFNNMIYTIGGTTATPDSSMRIVEVFDISKRIWFTAPYMSISRQAHTVSLIEGTLYAVGGTNVGPDWPGLTSIEAFTIK